MAKAKTTKTQDEPANAGDTGTTAPAVEKGTNDRFTRLFVNGEPAPAVKADGSAKRIAPQLEVIAKALAVFGEAGATRKELVDAITPVLTTKQPPSRILSYYQKDLVNFGLAMHVKGA